MLRKASLICAVGFAIASVSRKAIPAQSTTSWNVIGDSGRGGGASCSLASAECAPLDIFFLAWLTTMGIIANGVRARQGAPVLALVQLRPPLYDGGVNWNALERKGRHRFTEALPPYLGGKRSL